MTDFQDRRAINRLADKITDLERRLVRSERNRDLMHAAIDGGSGLEVVDPTTGDTVWSVAADEHGVVAPRVHNAIEPAAPAAPVLEGGLGAIEVHSSGLDVMGQSLAYDLKALYVYASTEPDFEPSTVTLKGVIPVADGSTTIAVIPGTWYVALRAESTSDLRSPAGPAAMIELEPLVSEASIREAIEQAQDVLADAHNEAVDDLTVLDERATQAEADLDEARLRLEEAEAILAPLPSIVDELQAATTELDTAAAAAAEQLRKLDLSAIDHERRLSDAVTRLSAAESTLSPLPGDVRAAQDAAQDAANAALAAEARATEANNRAMTRLANGNFEDGLKYWAGTATLTTDSHSGGNAVEVGGPSSKSIYPESFMPVVAGQIWELQFYYKALNAEAQNGSITGVFRKQDGATVGAWLIRPSVAGGAWGAASHRLTVPEGVDSIRPSIARMGSETNALWAVDDVVMRDVTDVVRLELAAQAAKKAGDDASEKARLLEVAMGGLDTRLKAAEGNITAASEQAEEDLAALDEALREAFGNADAALKSEAASDATAKANAARDAAEAEALRLAQAEAAAAQSAAEATAAADALTKANAARDAAISSASSDATAKANAAREAAKTAAAADAKAKADAAQSAAEAAAAIDALAKANAARDEAISSAAGDATTKAQAAEDAAKAAAAADAKAKADAAQAAAISAAAADAKAKADAAQAEALRLAKLDATAKADAAKTAAISAAASDAQTKFDEAKALADAAQAKADALAMSGDNLVLNGSGELGTLRGWENQGLVLAPQLAPPGAPNALVANGTAGRAVFSSDRIVVDPSRTYRMSAKLYGLAGMLHYLAVNSYDADGNPIQYGQSFRRKTADTTLAAPLNPGDTRIRLASAAGWTPTTNLNGIGWWPYTTAGGLVFNRADGYTRNTRLITGYKVEGNDLVLTSGWAGPSIPTGTEVGLMGAGGQYIYPRSLSAPADGWVDLSGPFGGGIGSGEHTKDATMFRPGTASIGVGFLLNNSTRVSGVSGFTSLRLVDVSADEAALKAQQDATAAQARADAAQSRADAAHTAAGSAQSSADAAMTRAGTAETNAKAHANSLPKVLHGTTAPSGTAPDGSVWFQHVGSLSGAVTGQWNRVAGAWVSTPIRSEAIANLDVGKLTAGSAVVGEAVTQKLLANEAVINRLTSAAAWIGGSIIKDGQITAPKITVTDELISNFFAANRALVNEELVVRGNLIADNATIISAALKNLSVAEKATFASAFADEMFAKMAVIDKLRAESAWIGGTLLEDGAVTAKKITVTDELIADMFKASRARIENELVVEGQLFAKNATLISAAMKSLSVTEKATFATAFADEMFAKMAVINRLTAGSAWIGGAQLKDGAITANHITASESMSSTLGQFLKVKAGQIESNAFEGQTFTGGTFTGALFQTVSTLLRGVKLSSTGLRAWDDTGKLTANIDGKNNLLSGVLRTAPEGEAGLVIDPQNASSKRPVLFFSPNGATSSDVAAIYTSTDWDLILRGRMASGVRRGVQIDGGLDFLSGGITGAQARILVDQVGGNFVHGRDGLGTEGSLTVAGASQLTGNATVSGILYANGRLRNSGATTTSYSSNVYIDTYGFLYRSSSASRYKVDQQVTDVDDALLDLPVKVWRDKAAVDTVAELDRTMGPLTEEDTLRLETARKVAADTMFGVIAEDVEKVDQRLATYDEDGRVNGVAYDRIGPALIPVVRRQRDRIAQLEAENQELRGRVARIEERLGLA